MNGLLLINKDLFLHPSCGNLPSELAFSGTRSFLWEGVTRLPITSSNVRPCSLVNVASEWVLLGSRRIFSDLLELIALSSLVSDSVSKKHTGGDMLNVGLF